MKLRKTKFTKVKQAVLSNNDELTTQFYRIEGNKVYRLVMPDLRLHLK